MEKMEEIMKKMCEYVCDSICRHRADAGPDQERLDDICAECEMGDYVCHVLNEYERAKRRNGEESVSWPDRMMNRFLQVQ